MTHEALAAEMAGLMKDYVRTMTSGLQDRLVVAETHLAALGEQTKALGAVGERLVVLETRPLTPVAEPLLLDQLTPDDLTAQAADLCRKAFGDVVVPLRRIQKRIVRDGQGRIDRVIEEPV